MAPPPPPTATRARRRASAPPPPAPPTATAATTAALASGLLASSCCVLQLALNAASIGCAGFSALTPYRPLFRALTAASLAALAARQGLSDRRTLATAAVALVLAASSDVLAAVNRRPPGGGGDAGTGVFWVQALPPLLPLAVPLPLLPPLVAAPLARRLEGGGRLAIALKPYLDASLRASGASLPTTPDSSSPRKVALRVKGVRCEACAARVRGALKSVGGVLNATVDVDRGEAVVYYDSSSGSEGGGGGASAALVEAIEGLKAGYVAEEVVVEDGGGGGGGADEAAAAAAR